MTMRYISTRGAGPFTFREAALAGLAPDGGLLLPEQWPKFSETEIKNLCGLSYQDLAFVILQRFIGDALSDAALKQTIAHAYSNFQDPAITPLRPLSEGRYLLELFHGPTLAFKDVALQWLGQLFDHLLGANGERAVVLGATSGDTGSAAMAGCAACAALDVFILYPHGRPSEIQRRQMTTLEKANIHALAVDGTFDDCQAIVKQLFADQNWLAKRRLLAVNSINWARIIAQIVYYFYAALQLDGPERSLTFVVPTGNFGNIFAGYAAGQMGLPIARLAAATNRNDAVHQIIANGSMPLQPVQTSLSPSMDIQLPSNFERLLFNLCGRDPSQLRQALIPPVSQALQLSKFQLGQLRQYFTSAAVTDAETLAAIESTYRNSGLVLDPHTAVGVAASNKLARELPEPVVTLACAHPAKFPETVNQAIGTSQTLPPAIQQLLVKTEHYVRLPNSADAIKKHILQEIV